MQVERTLKELFPQVNVALRIASPGLGEDFLGDLDKYKSVLTDFLRRQSPALLAWLDDVGWSMENGRILLTCPDNISMQYFSSHQLDKRVAQCIYDIFRVKVTVGLTVCGEREAWTKKMREERGFSFSPALAGGFDGSGASGGMEEPPPWDRRGAGRAGGCHGCPRGRSCRPGPRAEAQAQGGSRPETRLYAPAQAGQPLPVLKGRAIGDKPVDMVELAEDSGIVVIEGTVTGVNEPKELKGGETVLVTFAVYDLTSTIYCKAFYQYRMKRRGMGEEPVPPTDEERQRVKEQVDQIKNGMRVRLRGECRMDTFLGELSIGVRDMQQMPKVERMDNCEEKRIELHMHSQMSTMDATAEAAQLVATAARWGHPAVAITDHGSAQAFPSAFGAAKKNNIKLIPGVEGYLVDMVPIVKDADDRLLSSPIVVLDFETTGLSTVHDRIIEVGAVKLVDGQIVDELSFLCDPGVPLKPKITEITGISDLMLQGKESPAEGVTKLLEFIGDAAVAAHNASFDIGMLNAECERMGISFHAPVLDTLTFARRLYPNQKSYRLGALCRQLGVSLKNAHRAVHDAAATAQCLIKMYEGAAEKGAKTLQDLDQVIEGQSMGESYHIILLCKTQKGMQNLNHLISDSNVSYFYRHPNMPRFDIEKYREGLIIGSACEAGELFRAVVADRPDEEIERIAAFYDYLEIQPIGNNAFMLREGTGRRARSSCGTSTAASSRWARS